VCSAWRYTWDEKERLRIQMDISNRHRREENGGDYYLTLV
jgi:hypothetical protein